MFILVILVKALDASLLTGVAPDKAEPYEAVLLECFGTGAMPA